MNQRFNSVTSSSQFRVCTLGSRANLCVNPSVNPPNNFKNVSVINDRCLELQKASSKSKKCSFLHSHGIEELRDDILTEVQDIEEVAFLGRATKSCAYYASRLAISEADVIVLPYNVLLHAKTRASYGIDLKDAVVIVDEAHNLLETIASVHSTVLNSRQLRECAKQLDMYMQRYKTRLNAKNLLSLKQLSLFVNNLLNYLASYARQSDNKSAQAMMSVPELRVAAQLEHLNLFKVLNYAENSMLAKKLFGFSTSEFYRSHRNDPIGTKRAPPASGSTAMEVKPANNNQSVGTSAFLQTLIAQTKANKKQAKKSVVGNATTTANSAPVRSSQKSAKVAAIADTERNADTKEAPAPSSPLYQILEFMKSLTNPSVDGRVLIAVAPLSANENGKGDAPAEPLITLKYLLLNPSSQFQDIVDQCRSVVLAGGTMQPFSEFCELLFKPANVPTSRITTFTCGHVIPDNNLLAISLKAFNNSTGPVFDFSFNSRMKNDLISATGNVLSGLASAVPGGVVVFFSSYDYEHKVFTHWQRSGTCHKKFHRITWLTGVLFAHLISPRFASVQA